MKKTFQWTLSILALICYHFLLVSQDIEQDHMSTLSQEANEPFRELPELPDLNDVECNAKHHEHTVDLSLLEPILSAECQPLVTVANCVNLASGRFFHIEKNLTDETVEPLPLLQFYDSGNMAEGMLGLGWGLEFPLWASDPQNGFKHSYAVISEREGFLIPYQTHDGAFTIDPRVTKMGYTNLGRVALSNHSNCVNWKASFGSHEGYWSVKLGDHTKRIYGKRIKIDSDLQKDMRFPTPYAYLLTKEIKPNGNQLLFSYKTIKDKPCLSRIQAVSQKGKTLNELKFDYTDHHCTITNACGDSVCYQYNEAYVSARSHRKVLNSAESTQKGTTLYHANYRGNIDFVEGYGKLHKIEKPQGRFREIEYDVTVFPDKSGKVLSLIEPLGPNGEPVTTHQFTYYTNGVIVYDAHHNESAYSIDSTKRLTRKADFEGKTLIREENYEWLQKDEKEGWLKEKSVGINDQLYHLKAYRYDDRGNILSTTLYGNLTGEKPETFKVGKEQTTDHYQIEYTYHSHNLLKKKITPEGWVTHYRYLPDTNLCTEILQSYEGKIQERTFYTYDDNGQVKTKIEDDGSDEEETNLTDVTFRKIKVVEAETQHCASYGKPKVTKEYYLQNGQQIPLKTTELTYDTKGREIGQRLYDSHNILCYESTKHYDERGRLGRESNAVGDVTTYAWDENNNKIEEKLFSKESQELLTTHYEYDLANRLISKTETHNHGEVFVTKYSYNTLNQLVSETDPYGHTTTYAYDRYGNETRCTKPLFQDASWQLLSPTTHKTYNILNQPITFTDERGFTTTYSYNVYGSPTHITYPDGSHERSVYYPNGKLKQKWMADDTSIRYSYNAKGEPLKEIIFDPNGTPLKEEEYGYKGSLLLYKKDAMGLLTTYRYDGAGRKVEETIGNLRTIHYQYDDFDRLIKIEQEGQQITYQYDGLDRALSKIFQDKQGNLYAKETYAYDSQGNKIEKAVWQTDDKVAITKTHYHSDGTLAWREDPLGHQTQWQYDHHHRNGANQCVSCKSEIDPLGRPIVKTEDPLGHTVKKDIYDQGRLLSITHYFYDTAGNLTKEHVIVSAEGQALREYWIERTYNSRGWLETETEKPNDKSFRYYYDKMGRILLKHKPDGNGHLYAYDSLGRVKVFQTSEGSVSYTYHYDLHDNIIQVEDHARHHTLNRTYDPYNRLLAEEYDGQTTHYTYDSLDRLTSLTLPDGSSVSYTYDTFRLRKISRFESHKLAYEIELEYNLQGQPTRIKTPAGTTTYTHDLLGRPTIIQAPHWTNQLQQFDPVGNLLAMNQIDPTHGFESSFQYDRYNQLTEETYFKNNYAYDNIGNCLKKNQQTYHINDLNQMVNNTESDFHYDRNGNLLDEPTLNRDYIYDGANRLMAMLENGENINFLYDAFGRCQQIGYSLNPTETKQLLYLKDQEIGSLIHGKLYEFRIVHPDPRYDLTLAIELQGETYFPIQDAHHNICGLQNKEGNLAEWIHYSAFGLQKATGNLPSFNPWRFANKREIGDLIHFHHRFYNPRLMRWLTPDPLGFEDGLNLYAYVHNNPFFYKDPDGRNALVIVVDVVTVSFGAALAPVIFPALAFIAGTLVLGYVAVQGINYYHNYMAVQNANLADQEWGQSKFKKDDKKKPSEKTDKPKYDGKELGDDPTKCPGEGFEWRGNAGPETGMGSWIKDYKSPSQESLHPDLQHPPPKAPHWDYKGPDCPKGAELYLDGTWSFKE